MSSLIKSLETTDSDTRERSEIQAERDGRRKGLDKTSRIEWEPIATSVSVPCHPLICRLDILVRRGFDGQECSSYPRNTSGRGTSLASLLVPKLFLSNYGAGIGGGAGGPKAPAS
jgi:hypothetical protein